MSIYDDDFPLDICSWTILLKVGHWLCFLVKFAWLGKVMGLCLVIALVDLIRVHG